jgi:thiosulfate/3-mercaptopyruvate sulfurtransferase
MNAVRPHPRQEALMSLALASLVLLVPSAEKPTGYARPELLVEPAELQKVAAKGVRVLDARGKGKYLDGHFPGAVWVDATTWARSFGEGGDQPGWEKRIGALGLTAETPVAIYDDSQSKDAARMWWILRYWGFKDVRLVNGGWRGYAATGSPVEKGEYLARPSNPHLVPRRERLATKGELKEVVKNASGGPQIVDARSRGEYCGAEQTAKRSGAIPAATHLEWSDTLDQKTGRFKNAAELAKTFQEAGIDPARPSVTYCQSGGRASVMAFVLELTGGKDVRNYYKSWAEWGNDPETPVVTPAKK